MKIFVNGKFLGQRVTGVHRYGIEITKELINAGAEVTILVPAYMDTTSLQFFSENLFRKVDGFKNRILWEQVSLPQFLKKQRENYVLLSLCNIGTLFDKNQILCVHDMSYAVNPSWFTKSFAGYYRFMIPKLAKRAKRLITVSEFSKKQISEQLQIDHDEITVVYNAPSEKFTRRSMNEIRDIKDDFFLFVGSMDPRKNINLIVELFSLEEFKDQQLVIVGAKAKAFNEVQLNIPPNVKILDKCSDDQLAQLYIKARAMINPSFYEGFGIPLVEAMASGCPLIVSELEVFKEIAGDGAIYFDPYSLESLKAAFNSFLNRTKEETDIMINMNFVRSKNFSWRNSSEKLLTLINNLQ